METSLFPILKRFNDVRASLSSVILTEELTIHEKSFRSGSVFTVVGWREVNEKAYLIINKGSWEGLIDFSKFQSKLKKLYDKGTL
jgi:hypothetical protein